jgi:hypothetical protein
MHGKFLGAKSIPFCKGGSITIGRVEVGVLHMQSFWDSKVIKKVLIVEAHYFYDRHQKAASFLYEFLREAGQNNCANTHCLHGDAYVDIVRVDQT